MQMTAQAHTARRDRQGAAQPGAASPNRTVRRCAPAGLRGHVTLRRARARQAQTRLGDAAHKKATNPREETAAGG
jgi:hypothetical protein